MRLFRLLPLFLVMVCAGGCIRWHPVPQELVGSWTTDDATYQGKSLQIDQDFIVLVSGEDTLPKAERIDRITSTKEAGVTNYVINTRDKAGVHGTIRIMYRSAQGGELRLSNPSQVVWKRATPAG